MEARWKAEQRDRRLEQADKDVVFGAAERGVQGRTLAGCDDGQRPTHDCPDDLVPSLPPKTLVSCVVASLVPI